MDFLSVKNISKTYESGFLGRKSHKALIDVCISCREKEIFGIIGPNGAGKSTLIKILMGFCRPDAGSVDIHGSLAGSVEAKRTIGFLPENPSLYRHLTAKEHLSFSCKLYNIPKKLAREKIDNILQTVSLENSANTQVKNYSKGMRQRLALAYALINEPEILILDEPMSGLDPFGRHLMIDIIQRANEKGVSIMFCSHILTDVERICDRIGVMHLGRLIDITKPEDLHDSISSHAIFAKAPTPLERYFLQAIKKKG